MLQVTKGSRLGFKSKLLDAHACSGSRPGRLAAALKTGETTPSLQLLKLFLSVLILVLFCVAFPPHL